MIIYVFDFFFFNLTSLINCIICRGKTIWLICPEIMAQISDWHQYNSKHYKSLNSDSVPTRIKSLWWIPLAVLPTSVSWTNVRNEIALIMCKGNGVGQRHAKEPDR